MCIRDSYTPAQINQLINEAGGIGVADITTLAIVETCALDGFCVRNGEYAANKCCFESIENVADVCAFVLHTCDDPVITDWLPTNQVSGVTCEDDVVCVALKCWPVATHCNPKQEPERNVACEDPCKICAELRQMIFDCLKGQTLNWRNGPKARTFSRADIPETVSYTHLTLPTILLV